MFEQSILVDHAANKSWSVFVSLSAQVLLVGVAITVPLFFNEGLRQVQLAVRVNAPAPLPAPVRQTPGAPSRGVTVIPVLRPVFVAPSRVPEHVAMVEDATASVLAPPSTTGVPFSTGGTGPVSGLFDALNTKPPAPPRAAVSKPEKPVAPLPQGGRVQAAKLIKQVIPQYPALAKQARISGTVRLQGLIARDGTIKDLQLISGHPLLVQAAIQAVRQWVYRPTTLNGETVEVAAPIDVIFTLSQ